MAWVQEIQELVREKLEGAYEPNGEDEQGLWEQAFDDVHGVLCHSRWLESQGRKRLIISMVGGYRCSDL